MRMNDKNVLAAFLFQELMMVIDLGHADLWKLSTAGCIATIGGADGLSQLEVRC